MKAPLFCLMLALLLVETLAAVGGDVQWFITQHTYTNRKRNFDCTLEMNRKQSHLTYCRACSSVIMGLNSDLTPMADVLNICGGGGTQVEGNIRRSRENFRVVKCILTNGGPNVAPPRCVYRPLVQVGQVTVLCNHEGRPVHFYGCE